MRILLCRHKYRQIQKRVWTLGGICTDWNEMLMVQVGSARMVTAFGQLCRRVNLVAATIIIEACQRLTVRRESKVGNFQWIRILVLDERTDRVFDENANVTGCGVVK